MQGSGGERSVREQLQNNRPYEILMKQLSESRGRVWYEVY